MADFRALYTYEYVRPYFAQCKVDGIILFCLAAKALRRITEVLDRMSLEIENPAVSTGIQI